MTRGICDVKEGKLVGINETKNIVKTPLGAEVAGCPGDSASIISMNFWCYPAEFMNMLNKDFSEFSVDMKNPFTDEYLFLVIADGILKKGVEFTVLPTEDQWLVVTNKEDKQAVADSFKKLIEKGVYQENLYSDLRS